MESNAKQEPVAWKHDCAALLTNDVELWIDACPHCGKPRPAPQPKPAEQEPMGVPQGWKLVPDVPTNEWINNLAKTQTGPLEDVPFADIYQCIAELLDTAPEAPQPVKRVELTDDDAPQPKADRADVPVWDEVYDCAVAAYCRSSTSKAALRLCFQSRHQQHHIAVGWTANELMDFAKGIAALYTAPQPVKREPLTDEEFLQLLLKKGTTELVSLTTFVGESIQMQGKIGLLRGAKLLKEFVEAAHGIT